VDASVAVRPATVRANSLQFGVLEAGSGPLALCLHGFPDSAHTWRHLLPALAGAGFHAVAPFMRGYAPTAIPADGAYHLGALVADAVALHEVLGGDANAVLIGHDWGAEAAYGAAAFAPDRWRRLVTLAIPPAALDEVLFSDYEQLRRSFYLFMFRDPVEFAETVVAAMTWRSWTGCGVTGRLGSSPLNIWPGSRTACGSRPTWPPRSATTASRPGHRKPAHGTRPSRKRPAVRPRSPQLGHLASGRGQPWSWPGTTRPDS
jgi:pimeloyl-ACP methyl ester carboxylesterase